MNLNSNQKISNTSHLVSSVGQSTIHNPQSTIRAGILLVTFLTLIFGIVNWLWLRANVVSYGWDRAGHLVRSFVYNDIFREITPSTFFEALIASHYYPPLLPFTAAVSYQFFGVSEDVGVMVNVFYLALLLGAVWSIGRRLGGLAVANLATLVIGTFPMIYAMSRYFYLDFALTSLVAVTLALLLASERFTRRLPSFLFGLALGASFLVKWTTAAFVAFPLLFILWRGIGANVRQWANPRQWASARQWANPRQWASARLAPTFFRPHVGRLMLSLLIGVGIAGLLLLPARELIAQKGPFGLWLIPLFSLLIGAVIYALLTTGKDKSHQARALTNALGGGAIAALTMSLWYLPNFNFIYGFMEIAYGSETGSGRQLVYGEYLTYVILEQLGALYTLTLLIALIVLLWRWLRQKGWHFDETQIVLVLWAIVPFVIFTSNVSVTKSRYVMPFLPPFALWIALGLWRLRPKLLRTTAIRVVMLLAWAQFAIISFDALHGWRDQFVLELPRGEINLLANGFFIQYPAMERTDPGFAIVPQILARVEEGRQARRTARPLRRADDGVTLCLIVNTQQINNDHFLVDIYADFPKIRLRSLVENKSGKPTYPKLFGMDYVLLTTDYANQRRGIQEASLRASERILSKPDDLFNRAYRQVEQYPLPNGETYILYERRFADREPGLIPETYHKLMQEMGREFGENDTLILSAPDQSYIMGVLLPEDSPASLLPLPSDNATFDSTIAALARAAQGSKRLFLLSHNSSIADPEGHIEAWLRANTITGAETWIDSLRVSAFIPDKGASELSPINATFGNNGPTLEGLAFDESPLQPGDALTAALLWDDRDDSQISDLNLKVSLQLISPEGTLVAQQDTSRKLRGTTLTTGLQALALLIPRDITPGNYRLIVSLYDPQSLQRLPLADGSEVLELGGVEIGE
jgi:4-amino-4-deoxy-L-arabinose transferase-like glycosyltransferase